jgi:hypothetical protein
MILIPKELVMKIITYIPYDRNYKSPSVDIIKENKLVPQFVTINNKITFCNNFWLARKIILNKYTKYTSITN